MLPDLPEILTAGRERELLEWLIARKAAASGANQGHRHLCGLVRTAWSHGPRIRLLSRDANECGSEPRLQQDQVADARPGDRWARRALAKALNKAMYSLAEQVEGAVIADCGHYVMEEQPHGGRNPVAALLPA